MSLIKSTREFFALERNILILAFLTFTFSAGYALWATFLPKFFEGLGASVKVIGMIFSLFAGITVFSSIVGGHLADRFSRKNIIISSGFLIILSFILYVFSFNVATLLLPLIVYALAFPSFSIARRALAVDSLPKKKRATGYSFMWAFSILPIIFFTPLAGWLVKIYGMVIGVKTAFILSVILFVFGLIPILFIKEKWKAHKERIRLRISLVWKFLKKMPKSVKYLIFVTSIIFLGTWIAQPYIVLFALNIIEITPFQFGILMMMYNILSFFIVIISGKFADKFGRKPIILITLIFLILSYGLLSFARNLTHFILVLLLASLGSASFASFGQPITTILLAELGQKGKRGRIFGVSDSLTSIALIPGPLIGGMIYSVYPRLTFLIASLIMVVSFMLALKYVKESK